MLKKLYKYDMQYMNRQILPFIILSIAMSFLTRGFYELSSNLLIFKIMYYTSVIITNALIINMVINTVIRMIIRFTNNLYGDESYLMHTLPVERKKLLLSKILTGTTYLFLTILVALICLLIEYYTKDRFQALRGLFVLNANELGMSASKIITMIIVYFIFMIEWMQLMLYSAIELGHRHNDKKGIMSFVYAIVLYFATQFINLIVLGITILVNSDIMDAFKTNTLSGETLQILLWLIVIINFVYVVGYFIYSNKLIERHLNVD